MLELLDHSVPTPRPTAPNLEGGGFCTTGSQFPFGVSSKRPIALRSVLLRYFELEKRVLLFQHWLLVVVCCGYVSLLCVVIADGLEGDWPGFSVLVVSHTRAEVLRRRLFLCTYFFTIITVSIIYLFMIWKSESRPTRAQSSQNAIKMSTEICGPKVCVCVCPGGEDTYVRVCFSRSSRKWSFWDRCGIETVSQTNVLFRAEREYV